MKLWLLCFVILFAAAEGLQGIGGGLNLFSGGAWHPLTVLAGIGLEVLSNANALGLKSAPPAANPKAADPKAAPKVATMPANPQPAPAPTSIPTPAPARPKPSPTLPNSVGPRPKAKTPIKANAISFDLRNDIREGLRDDGRQPMRKSS